MIRIGKDNTPIVLTNAKGPGSSARARHSRPAGRGVGDRLAAALKKLGVTEERYAAAKAAIGLPPTCGCKERREWLNRLGDWLGVRL